MPQNSVEFERLFNALPSQYFAVNADLVIVAATDSILTATLKDRSIVGMHVLDAFPNNPNDPDANGETVLRESLERVMKTKQIDILKPQRYDMERADGSYEVRYWQPLNAPVFDDTGEIVYIVHGAEDVTAQMTES